MRESLPYARLWRLSWPAMLSGLSVPLVGLVDAFVVGRLPQPEALGAVALGGWLFDLIFWSVGFLRMGTTGLVAQASGRGDALEVSATFARALCLALTLGVALTALSPLCLEPLLSALSGGDALIVTPAHDYLSARLLGGTAALINYVCLGWLLGRGRAKTALLLQLTLNLLNVALSLRWGPLEGVAGVGWASAVAQWCVMVVGVSVVGRLCPWPEWAELRGRLGLFEPWGALLSLSRDLFVRTALLLSVFGAVNAMSARLGPIALSANALLLHLQTLQAFALDGFAHGVEVMTGEAVGERSPERLRVTLKAAWRLTMGTAALIALTYAFAHPWLLRQLSAHEGVVERAEGLIIWAVISPLISAPCFLLDGVMIGATRSAEMRRGMIYSALTFALSATLLVPTWGAHGLWAALMCFMVARAWSLRGGSIELSLILNVSFL